MESFEIKLYGPDAHSTDWTLQFVFFPTMGVSSFVHHGQVHLRCTNAMLRDAWGLSKEGLVQSNWIAKTVVEKTYAFLVHDWPSTGTQWNDNEVDESIQIYII